MLYASYAQMLDAKGLEEMTVLTDRENNGAPVQATAEGALEDASRLIDGYLTHKYSLPLSTAPAALRRLCIDIAAYFLAGNHASLTEDIKARYDAAIRFLEQVATGKAGLGLSEPVTQAPAGADGSDNVLFAAPEKRLMTRENLKGM